MLSNVLRSLLLIEFVASTAIGNDVKNAIARKDKSSLPIPVSTTVLLERYNGLMRPAVLYVEISADEGLFHVHRQVVSPTVRHRQAM